MAPIWQQHLLQLRLLLVVQSRVLDQADDVVVQVGVDQLELGVRFS